jgi:hypothetical protein
MDENINTMEENKEALLKASKEVGLEVNTEKKYKFKSRHQKAGQNIDTNIANKHFANVAKF